MLPHDWLDLELMLAFQLIMLGCFIQLLALLPTDKLFVDRASIFASAAGSTWVLVCIAVVAVELRRGMLLSAEPSSVVPSRFGMYPNGCGTGAPAVLPCWWPYVNAARTLAWALLVLQFVARVLVYCVPWPAGVRRALCLGQLLSSRARLELQWRAKGLVTAGSFGVSVALLAARHVVMPPWVSLETLGDDVELIASVRRERVLVLLAWVGTALQGGVSLCCFIPLVRIRLMAFLAARSEGLSAAAGIAALIGDSEPGAVQRSAEAAFRSITLDKLTFEELAHPTPDPALYARSIPAAFGEVDAFVSHSWSDDAEQKWTALQAWRNHFRAQCGREPKLWIDKCCIDQRNIEMNLLCLPVFLAGCHTLLCFVGHTYLTRLWCVVELAVFLEMGGELHRIAFVPLGLEHGVAPPAVESAPGEDEVLAFDGSAEDASGKVGALPAHRHSAHGYADLQQRVSTFDVRAAQCAVSFERERLLAMVEQGFGGAHEFNLSLRAVLEPLSVDMPAIRPAAGAARGEGSPMRSTVAFLDAHSTVERAIAAAERAVAIATVFIGQANPPGLSRLPSPQSSRQGAVSPQSSRQGAVRGLTSAEEEVDTADAAAVPAVLAA